jgi:hypothetical protein
MNSKFSSENRKGIDMLEDLIVDRRIIFRWFLRKRDMRVWTGFIRHRMCTGGAIL